MECGLLAEMVDYKSEVGDMQGESGAHVLLEKRGALNIMWGGQRDRETRRTNSQWLKQQQFKQLNKWQNKSSTIVL